MSSRLHDKDMMEVTILQAYSELVKVNPEHELLGLIEVKDGQIRYKPTFNGRYREIHSERMKRFEYAVDLRRALSPRRPNLTDGMSEDNPNILGHLLGEEYRSGGMLGKHPSEIRLSGRVYGPFPLTPRDKPEEYSSEVGKLPKTPLCLDCIDGFVRGELDIGP